MTGVRERQHAARAMRRQMWLPGRPSAAHREDPVLFWEATARCVSSDGAVVAVEVSSAVNSRSTRSAADAWARSRAVVVRNRLRWMPSTPSRPVSRATRLRPDPNPVGAKLGVDLGSAVGAPAHVVDPANPAGEIGILVATHAYRA